MTSPTVNVVRYSAVAFGIAYGWYHRRTLQAAHDKYKIGHAVHEREQLIKEAKEAYKRKKEGPKDSGGLFCALLFMTGLINVRFWAGVVITDPEDPRFDLEKLLVKYEKAAS
ncbi:hypothetical protein AX15_001341 [Amanita polypyramis BW_CC]|nr:hypothetical protein AX15_001341 [Amanita polypyramis BW_CC]